MELMKKKDFMNLKYDSYHTMESGFYFFLKWYEKYIGDLKYEEDDLHTFVLDKEHNNFLAFIIKGEPLKFFAVKVYFDLMKDFDFKRTLPRKTTEIVKKNDNEMFAKITTYDFLNKKKDNDK